MKSEGKQRVLTYDIMKAIAIFMVVMYHGNTADWMAGETLWGILNYYAYSFMSCCVPIFFFVNGMLMFNRPFDDRRHIVKTLRLAGMTLLWAAISIGIVMLVKDRAFDAGRFIEIFTGFEHGWTNHLWFLVTLFVLQVMSPLLKCIHDEHRTYFIFFFVLTMLTTFGLLFVMQACDVFALLTGRNYRWAVQNLFYRFGIGVGEYGYALGYYMLGGLLAGKTGKRTPVWIWLALVLTMLSGLTGLGIMYSNRNGDFFDTVWNGYDTVFTLGMTVGLYFLCQRITLHGWLKKAVVWLGANTLGIYLLHALLINLTKEAYCVRMPWAQTAAGGVAYVLLIVAVSAGATWLLKKIPGVRNLFVL